MIKIVDAFQNGKAFIPFITCGFPDPELSVEIFKAAAEGGADLIEVGVPFSDPIAEGPVIQEADAVALEAGVTTDKVFDIIREVRKTVRIPMLIMTYANVVFSYGIGRFCEKAAALDVNGLILPDVPWEEREEFAGVCRKHDIDFIPLIAPTSHDRIKHIAKDAEGFVYVVSSMGVTGVRENITTDLHSMVRMVKEEGNINTAIGFGIAVPEQAKAMASIADGVIVGSALIKVIMAHGKDCAPYVKEYVKSMKDAIREL